MRAEEADYRTLSDTVESNANYVHVGVMLMVTLLWLLWAAA